MKTFQLFPALFFTILIFFTSSASAQEGDQILDGIGETDLIARYIFRGDAKDWSRNDFNAKIHGDGAQFVDDELFGKVLLLPGDNKSYVSVPGEALNGIESLSITGWVYLLSSKEDQRYFKCFNILGLIQIKL